MNLATPPDKYDRSDHARVRQAIQAADKENFKKGRDVRLENGERLILKDTVTGDLYQLQFKSGVLTVTGPL